MVDRVAVEEGGDPRGGVFGAGLAQSRHFPPLSDRESVQPEGNKTDPPSLRRADLVPFRAVGAFERRMAAGSNRAGKGLKKLMGSNYVNPLLT